MEKQINMGLDIGSTTIKIVLTEEEYISGVQTPSLRHCRRTPKCF